jgi:hypothetical protein
MLSRPCCLRIGLLGSVRAFVLPALPLVPGSIVSQDLCMRPSIVLFSCLS